MRASEIKSRLVQVYESAEDLPAEPVSRYLRVLEWTGRASNFIEASAKLADSPLVEHHFYPRMLLAGHGLECALKAALLATGLEPQATHDLVALSDEVQNRGFRLFEPQLALIVHVDHYYHRDLRTKTKFKARYPTADSESDGGLSPPAASLSRLVQELQLQTSQANERLNRKAWSGVEPDA